MIILKICSFIPDSYYDNVYKINYLKLYESGIRFIIFDLDGTLLPFDDMFIPDSLFDLFFSLNSMGFDIGICSNNSKKRVETVGNLLKVNYLSNAGKPLCDFKDVSSLFKAFDFNNTVFIGDSFYLDMFFASRFNLYKIMVNSLKNDNFKFLVSDFLQNSIWHKVYKLGLRKGKFYKGVKEW